MSKSLGPWFSENPILPADFFTKENVGASWFNHDYLLD